MTDQHIMTQVAFARRAGCDPSTIHKLLHNRLKKAVVENKIDANHPAAVRYLEEREEKQKAGKTGNTRIKDTLGDQKAWRVPEDMEAFAHMTLEQIVMEYGTDTRFKEWLGAVKTIDAIEKVRLDNEQTKKNLVKWDLVSDHIIGTFDAAHLELLQNGTTKLAFTLDGLSKSGANLAELEDEASKIIGNILSTYKDKLARTLRKIEE